MTPLIDRLAALHATIFSAIERALDGWFFGLFARFAFASVLWIYYLNSARTKVGDGLLGFFSVADNAYYQILPPVIEAAGFDASNIAFFPWRIVVYLGTYAEFALPLLIVFGLFTRLAALGMIGFIAVQTYVDIVFHGIGAEAVGAMFDRFPDAVILDQRLLWLVPLVYLVVKGAGLVSLDHVLGRFFRLSPAAESASAGRVLPQ